MWVVKLDASGNVEWEESIGGTQYDQASDIEEITKGKFIMAGFSDSEPAQSIDYRVVKFYR